MTNLLNNILSLLVKFTRILPDSRSLNKLYKLFNKLFLAFGVNPIVNAKMKDNTIVRVDLSTKTERLAYYTGKYDSDLISIIVNLIRPHTTILDVGGNIGFYSVALGKFIEDKGLSSKVVSFEPFIGNFKRLSYNIITNGLENICLVNNYGLSNQTGISEITLREDFKHGSKTGNAAIPTNSLFDEGFKTSTIILKVLDEVWENDFNDYPSIDIIKMDIEGHEDFCIEGGVKTIRKFRPVILMEVNKPYYAARKVNLDETLLKHIPSDYLIFRKDKNKWVSIESLEVCDKIDNVFLIPKERLDLSAYSIFNN